MARFDDLVAAVEDDPYLGVELLAEVAGTGDPRVPRFLADVVRETDPATGSYHELRVMEAIELLGAHGDADAPAVIRARLGGALIGGDDLTAGAVTALVRLGDPHILDELTAAVVEPPPLEREDHLTIPWLVRTLVEHRPGDEALIGTFALAARSRKPLAKAAGVLGLALVGRADGAAVRALLSSKDARVVMAGMQALGGSRVPVDEAVRIIKGLPDQLLLSPWGAVCVVVAARVPFGDALAALADDEPWVRSDPYRDPLEFRTNLLEGALALGSEAAPDAIRALAEAESDPTLRAHWTAVLAAARPDPAVAPSLVPPLSENRDPVIAQKTCVRALGAIARLDVRAHIALVDLLHDARREKFRNRAFAEANAEVVRISGAPMYRDYPDWRARIVGER